MAGFLLDVHIPLDVLAAFRRLVPDAGIEHVARWRGGALRTERDETILAAAAGSGLILVTFDVHTVRPLADRWIAAGRRFPGVVMIVESTIAPTDIGSIARGLARLHRETELLDPAYPVVYLQAP